MSDELVEGNKENKAKKNKYVTKLGKSAIVKGARDTINRNHKDFSGHEVARKKMSAYVAGLAVSTSDKDSKRVGRTLTKETVEHEEVQPTLYSFIEALVAGDLDAADEFLETSLAFKVDATLDALKNDVAESLFDEELEEGVEVISQEEFDALSEDEQAEYEEVELEEIEEGNAANKAKKREFEKTLTKNVAARRNYNPETMRDEVKAGRKIRRMAASSVVKKIHAGKEWIGESVDLDEGNKENKGKKNAVAQKMSKLNRLSVGRSLQKGSVWASKNGLPQDTLATSNKMKAVRVKRKFAESTEEIVEGNAENKAKKNAYAEKKGKNLLQGRVGFAKKTGRTAMQKGKGVDDLRLIKNKAAAKIAMRKEGVEQIDELQKSTLKSYVNKAASSAFLAGDKVGSSKLGSEKNMKGYEKGTKRLRGIRTAVNKLASESVAPLSELNKKTLKSYVKKATTSAYRNHEKAAKEEDKAMSTDGNKHPEKQERHNKNAIKAYDKAEKREKGIKTAKSKI